jgi:LPS-assembly protein
MQRGTALYLGTLLATAPLSLALAQTARPPATQPGANPLNPGLQNPNQPSPSQPGPNQPGSPQPGQGQGASKQSPVTFSADEVQYDEELGLVVAKGNVELTQRDEILLADTVTYNQRTDTATASGHVSLLEPSGDIIFADYMELHDNMRDGFLKNVRMLLADRTRVAGNTARRIDGNRTEIRRGIYSACDACAEDPTRPPVWQLKAEDVVHDKQQQLVEYRDAVMEIDGVPVFWTPYISHPDPSVKRASGLLTPTIGNSTANGYRFGIPYYWVISPESDATINPIYYSSGGDFIGGEYRQRFANGYLTNDASITFNSKAFTDLDTTPVNSTRWNIDTEGVFDLDQNWRAGGTVFRASDQTYLLRYELPSPYDFLTSHLFLENFGTNSYANISSWSFQSLETGVGDSIEPIVAPVADYRWVGPALGGNVTAEGNVLNLLRVTGFGMERASTGGQWRDSFADPIGGQYKLTAGLRADGYQISGYQSDNLSNTTLDSVVAQSGTAGRVFPQTTLTWSYPWVRQAAGYSQTIEPVVMLAASPYGENPGKIPNEDSQGLEFDDTMLFLPNRFAGYDRVDSGQRVDYGLRTGIYGDGGGSTRFIIGQSYAAQLNDSFESGSGLDHHFSDVVGRATFTPNPLLNFTYAFRLGYDDLAMRRQEVGTSFGPSNVRIGLNYIQIAEIPGATTLDKAKELSASLSLALTRYWSTQLVGTYDFSGSPTNTAGQIIGLTETLTQGISVTYRDECLAVVTSLTQSGVRAGDAIPGTTLLLSFVFKNIGDFGIPAQLGGGL